MEIRAKENIRDFHVLLAIHKYFLANLLFFAWNRLKLLSFANIFSLISLLFSNHQYFLLSEFLIILYFWHDIANFETLGFIIKINT